MDYEICGAEEWQAEERHVVQGDGLETVDQELDFGGIGWIFLSFGVDFVIGNKELMVGYSDVETWVD